MIGAYFHAHKGDFKSFEAKIREMLAQGLIKQMFRNSFSYIGLMVVGSVILIGFIAICTALIRALIRLARWIVPRALSLRFETFEVRSPLHRFASRTTLL